MKKYIPLILLIFILPIGAIGQKDNNYKASTPEESLLSSTNSIYGSNIAVNDNIAVVASNHGGSSQDLAYLYEKKSGVWERIAQLKPSNASSILKIRHEYGRINIVDDLILLSDLDYCFRYTKPEEGWKDMIATEIESFTGGSPLSSQKVSSTHDQVSFFISRLDAPSTIYSIVKQGNDWVKLFEKQVESDDLGLVSPIVEGNQIIDKVVANHILHISSYSDIGQVTDAVYEYEKEILNYEVDYGKILVSLKGDDNLRLYNKEGESYTANMVPFILSPSQENYWIPTKHSFITENMISAVYADPAGKLSVLCFEKSGDTWNDMNETAIISLPEGIDFPQKGMIVHNENDLMLSGDSHNSNSVIVYTKSGNTWSEGYSTSILSEDYVPSAVGELPESNLLSVYPNPVQDQLHIELKDKQSAQISIYDLQGRLMDSFEMEGISATYNTSTLPKGTYIIKVLSEDKMIKHKVIK